MKANVAIIIPTYNQPNHLAITLHSIVKWTKSTYRIYVVDNSVDGYAEQVASQISSYIKVLRPVGKNLGWMGGINYGIANSTEDFILMCNDDIKILDFDNLWLQKLLESFSLIDRLGAVGPGSNFVMGSQNFLTDIPAKNVITTALSGFCLLTKRSIIDEIGGLDDTLSGGDDLDFSIRLRKAKYWMSARRDVFVYHFGSKTGKSVHGNYWDSPDYANKHYTELIRKHGFKNFLTAIFFNEPYVKDVPAEDWERELMIKHCVGYGVDIGCGDRKVLPEAVGVDLTPKGEAGMAGSQLGQKSQADIAVEDIKLPFPDGIFDYIHSRHVFEHIVDGLEALREWVRVLRPKGKLIVAMPDEEVVDGMPLDPSHKHSYTLDSFKNLLACVCDFKVIAEKRDDISFVLIAEINKCE